MHFEKAILGILWIFWSLSEVVVGGKSVIDIRALGFNGPPPSIKIFDGRRLRNDSILMVYYHELTVAVVELGPKKLLLNCNLIEIYSNSDVDKAMGPLRDVTTPIPITFKEMIHLMDQCVQLDMINRKYVMPPKSKNRTTIIDNAAAYLNNQFVLLKGIVPGTKWCGTGDVAKDYHDLGEEVSTDMCCRNHDLCPVKIRAFSKKYDLDNDSLYTKSHCVCDDMFHNCMRKQTSDSAQLLGLIYFNLVKVPCVQEGEQGRTFRDAKKF